MKKKEKKTKAPIEPEHKLYILIRGDLSPEQQAVQAGHAVAKFCQDHPNVGWSNGTLIYLRVKDDLSLPTWSSHVRSMHRGECFVGHFYDPDLPNDPLVNSSSGGVTATYMYGYDVEFLLRDLPLMRFK